MAAGYSSRMGVFKPLLRLGDMTLIEREINLFQSAGVEDVRVVAGYRSADLSTALRKSKVRVLENKHYQNGMFSSVVTGVKSIEKHCEAFFVLPVDIPLVRHQTIAALLSAHRASKGGILYPRFFEWRGHPPLINAQFAKEIIGWEGSCGLRGFLKSQEAYAVNIDVADEYILRDLDTQADYQELLEQFGRYDMPTLKESIALLANAVSTEYIFSLLDHSWEVASLASALASALNRNGCQIDEKLILAGGLLHDIGKGMPDHAGVGAEILCRAGFPAVASVVGAHMDISIKEEEPISAHELIYLADKLVEGNKIVTLKMRFDKKVERFADDKLARQAIMRRFESACKIQQRFEKIVDITLDEFLRERASLPYGYNHKDLFVKAWGN